MKVTGSKFRGYLFFSVLVSLAISSNGQELIICKKHDNRGLPTQIGNEWEMDQNPKYVTFIYNNGKTTIDNRHINFVFTPITHKDVPADSVRVAIGQSSNWIATKYGFTQPGDYKVKVMIPNGSVLAEGKVLLKGVRMLEEKKEEKPREEERVVQKPLEQAKEEEPMEQKPPAEPVKEEPKIEPPAQVTKPDSGNEMADNEDSPTRIYPDVSTMGTLGADISNQLQGIELIEDAETEKYFEHLYVQFGREIKANMLMGQNEKFKLKYEGTHIECLFTHTKPLESNWIGMSLWRREKSTKDYTEHIEEQKIDIRPTDHTAKFAVTFKKRGYYRVALYTDDLKKMGYAYVFIY